MRYFPKLGDLRRRDGALARAFGHLQRKTEPAGALRSRSGDPPLVEIDDPRRAADVSERGSHCLRQCGFEHEGRLPIHFRETLTRLMV